MLNENHANHEEFSVDYLDISPRSRLYQPPIAEAGTKDIEGLISYIVRVAAAHSVSPWRLLKKIYAVENADIKAFMYPSFFNKYSSTINGLGKYAEIFATGTEKLTGSSQLRNTTLLSLANLLPTKGCGLLLDKPQWCPECINEMLISKEPTYRPLSWSLKLYRACTTHKRPLVDTCPHCDRVQPFIPRYPDLSRCAYCYQGLNSRKHTPITEPSEIDCWVSIAIEDLIANLDKLDSIATSEYLSAFIRAAINHFSNGNRTQFCKSIGLNSWAVKGWLTKNEMPSLPQFLSICYGLDTLPSRLFLEDVSPLLNKPKAIRQLPVKLIGRAERPLLTNTERASLFKWIKSIAEDVNDCRSLYEISKILSHTSSCLKYWFPNDCAVISTKHSNHKKKCSDLNTQNAINNITFIVNNFYEAGQYPSRRKVNIVASNLKISLARPSHFHAYKKALKNQI